MKLFNNVAIVGAGLIGGSIGLGIKKRGLALRVIGIGHHKKAIQEALRVGAIDEGTLNLNGAKDADLIILAAPVSAIKSVLPKLSNIIKRESVVIDTGSTKAEIMRVAKKSGINFIGCHPLAGTEKKGPINSNPDLFKGALCLITPLNKRKGKLLSLTCQFWERLCAKVKITNPREHDRVLAYTSHLPHAVAYCLINCIGGNYLKFSSTGLKDTTRIASSDPKVWRDIFISNSEPLLKATAKFKAALSRIEALVKKNQPERLESFLKQAKNKRDGIQG